MNKLLLTISFLISFNLFSTLVLAEVNIDLLKQKYPKCEDTSYRHNCFADHIYSLSRQVGYFRNNDLWDGLSYQSNILLNEYINGKKIAKSFCIKSNDGWYTCPSGNRFKALETGYLDKKDKRQGKFKFEYKGGSVYVGEYKNGRKHGYGIYKWIDEDKYSGEWKNGQLNGQGTNVWKKSGNKYIGLHIDGLPNGQGTKTYADGTIEEGIWKDNKFMYVKKPTPSSNPKIEEYKSFCSEIGFTPGTEKFGDCVVEAMKKG